MASGRPRGFDIDSALEAALQVFWRRGYEGASMNDLTAAMGVTRPSLYAAFGNKEELFRKAMDRYAACRWGFAAEALAEQSSRLAVERLLRGFAGLNGDDAQPKGCLMVQSALVCSEESSAIREELARQRSEGEGRLAARLAGWQAEGDLPESADPQALARFVAALANGLAVQAAGGAGREALESVVQLALSTWPQRPDGRGDTSVRARESTGREEALNLS